MSKDFSELEAYCSALLANIQPSARRKLARRIATDLRASNAKQIASQKNPDGTAFTARKSQRKKGSIRRTMFAKLRQRKWLKTEASPNNAIVAFASQVKRIAEVHHYGLRDRVMQNRDFKVQYAERQLLGFNDDNIDQVKQAVLEQLAK